MIFSNQSQEAAPKFPYRYKEILKFTIDEKNNKELVNHSQKKSTILANLSQKKRSDQVCQSVESKYREIRPLVAAKKLKIRWFNHLQEK